MQIQFYCENMCKMFESSMSVILKKNRNVYRSYSILFHSDKHIHMKYIVYFVHVNYNFKHGLFTDFLNLTLTDYFWFLNSFNLLSHANSGDQQFTNSLRPNSVNDNEIIHLTLKIMFNEQRMLRF